MSKTRIEWADAVWNPVTGCAPVSEGCQNCYAKRMANRLRGRCGYPENDPFRVTLHPERLDEPLKWKKPRKVFVCSMSDLFHEDVPEKYIIDILSIMAEAHWHTFLILTKRPVRMADVLTSPTIANDVWVQTSRGVNDEKSPYPLPNVWLGVTAENQARADERIPILLQIPAAVRFVSVEPMLGPVDLTEVTLPNEYQPPHIMLPSLTGFKTNALRDDDDHIYQSHNHLDWVICGGETGPGARPVHPDWVRSLRDQCQASGVPFFFKQWGEHCYPSQMTETTYQTLQEKYNLDIDSPWRVGKKAAGRILDGRTWDEMPGRSYVYEML